MADIKGGHIGEIIEQGLSEMFYPFRRNARQIGIDDNDGFGLEFNDLPEKVFKIIPLSFHARGGGNIDLGYFSRCIQKGLPGIIGGIVVAIYNHRAFIREIDEGLLDLRRDGESMAFEEDFT